MFTAQLGPVKVAVVGRAGGVSHGPYASLNLADYVGDDAAAVASNRELVRKQLGANDLAWLRAEHGNRVLTATTGGEHGPADALTTSVPGLAIAALAADCVPIVLVGKHEIGVVHCGWKGLVAGVVPAALASVRGVHAALVGPSICGQCYEVPAQRVHEVAQLVPDAVVDETHLDVAAGVRAQLEGVLIDSVTGCTLHDEGWFSYRAAHGGPTGRGGLVAVIDEL